MDNHARGSGTIPAPRAAESSGGDPELMLFEDFFVRHRARLFQALWLMVRNRQEAEEIAQDAFVRVWERWATVAAHPDQEGYLYRTAMNVAHSRRRRLVVALRRGAGAPSYADPLLGVEEHDAVMRALACLTPRQRAAVVLVDLLGLNSVDAAEALGTRPSTVRVLLARGRDTLRKEWHRDV